MEEHRENRELGNAEWKAIRRAKITEEMGLDHQAKEALRKEKESQRGRETGGSSGVRNGKSWGGG